MLVCINHLLFLNIIIKNQNFWAGKTSIVQAKKNFGKHESSLMSEKSLITIFFKECSVFYRSRNIENIQSG